MMAVFNEGKSRKEILDYGMDKEDASILLSAMEAAGMQPPEVQIEIADNDSGCVEEGFYTSISNEWEPEYE